MTNCGGFSAIAIDSADNVYLGGALDGNDARIHKFSADGVLSEYLGGGFDWRDPAILGSIQGIAVDASGRALVTALWLRPSGSLHLFSPSYPP
jgi:hypothetical protein